jgi:hypothetical protein
MLFSSKSQNSLQLSAFSYQFHFASANYLNLRLALSKLTADG